MTGEPVKWRRSPQMLISRSIPKAQLGEICEMMINDGLIVVLMAEGLCWYSGRYKVSASEIKRVWGLSRTQYRRLVDYIYANGFAVDYVGDGN